VLLGLRVVAGCFGKAEVSMRLHSTGLTPTATNCSWVTGAGIQKCRDGNGDAVLARERDQGSPNTPWCEELAAIR
jgi:hypothetical protein